MTTKTFHLAFVSLQKHDSIRLILLLLQCANRNIHIRCFPLTIVEIIFFTLYKELNKQSEVIVEPIQWYESG